MNAKEKNIRLTGILLFETFALITVIVLIVKARCDKLLLAAATPFIILVPKAVELLFQCRISLPVYLFSLFYTVGPMLGECYNLYYTVSWWDKFLHTCGGVIFAFFGFFLFEKYVSKSKKNVIITAIFALCFSMAISVFWELFEYGADVFLGSDMQHDTVITNVNSYLLGESVGNTGSIENIKEVIVNGETLPVNGYIDVGLNDTMLDMLLESFGALITAIIYIISKGKFTFFKQDGVVVSIKRTSRNLLKTTVLKNEEG